MSRRLLLSLAMLLVVAIGYALWPGPGPGRGRSDASDRRSGPLTVAAAGDLVLTSPSSLTKPDPGLEAVCDVIGSATVAVANLEVTVLGATDDEGHETRSDERRPFVRRREAEGLARCGFNLVTRANNHVADHGAEGIRATGAALDAVGVRHAGAGEDLGRARETAFVGDRPRRAAVISVATSSAPEARATQARGEIKGRPGLSPLRYSADITADAVTFETLRQSMGSLEGATSDEEGGLTLFGTAIRKGDRTEVHFSIDERDERDVLTRIAEARASADAVVVALHSHEPSNQSEEPADFVRRFARAAVDAGATLVVGHGPRRIRGVEVYNGGIILYSVGTFMGEGLARPRSLDVFDRGVDLYRLALGALDDHEAQAEPAWHEREWWEGLVAVATFEGGRPAALRLHAIDLGAARPLDERGTPRLAGNEQATAILQRVARLSAAFGTTVTVAGGLGTVELPHGASSGPAVGSPGPGGETPAPGDASSSRRLPAEAARPAER